MQKADAEAHKKGPQGLGGLATRMQRPPKSRGTMGGGLAIVQRTDAEAYKKGPQGLGGLATRMQGSDKNRDTTGGGHARI